MAALDWAVWSVEASTPSPRGGYRRAKKEYRNFQAATATSKRPSHPRTASGCLLRLHTHPSPHLHHATDRTSTQHTARSRKHHGAIDVALAEAPSRDVSGLSIETALPKAAALPRGGPARMHARPGRSWTSTNSRGPPNFHITNVQRHARLPQRAACTRASKGAHRVRRWPPRFCTHSTQRDKQGAEWWGQQNAPVPQMRPPRSLCDGGIQKQWGASERAYSVCTWPHCGAQAAIAAALLGIGAPRRPKTGGRAADAGHTCTTGVLACVQHACKADVRCRGRESRTPPVPGPSRGYRPS